MAWCEEGYFRRRSVLGEAADFEELSFSVDQCFVAAVVPSRSSSCGSNIGSALGPLELGVGV